MSLYKYGLILFFLMTIQLVCMETVNTAPGVPRFLLSGEEINPEPAPLWRNGRLLIPLRFVAESAGAVVCYDQNSSKATIENDASVVEIWLDKQEAMVNGIERVMGVPAVLREGRLFIPLRFWLENAGYSVFYDEEKGAVDIEVDTALNAKILSFEDPVGEYYPGDEVSANLTFINSGNLSGTFWIGYSVKDMEGGWFDVPAHAVMLEPGERSIDRKKWLIPTDEMLVSGPFQAVMAIWDAPPGSPDALRLAQAETEAAFKVFNVREDFSSFDHARWVKEKYRIGRSDLRPENVEVQDGKLRITIPAGTTEGGSIRTKEQYLYGSYRASIRVAHAPSSITGFFLYKKPDLYHEIDIEIYNDNSREIMFVTYAENQKTNDKIRRLDFDPTADFHEYRIDFYSSGVSFYVDGRLLNSWSEGLTNQPMQLMLNTWFPDWLDGEKVPAERHTYVDWIKY